MRLDLSPDEHLETRRRPAWLPRWQRYVPGIGLTATGLVAAASPGPVLDPLTDLGLTWLGATLLLAAGLLAVTVLASKLAGRHPVPVLILGTFCLSLGANLTQTPWLAVPSILAGSGWIGALEVERLAGGLAMTDRRIVLPKLMRAPFGLDYEELHVVHTTRDEARYGSLILETEHGTVTVTDVPGHVALAQRIEARMDAEPLPAEPPAVAEARSRIERLIDGATGKATAR